MAHLADFKTDQKYKAAVTRTERLTPADTDEVREIAIQVNQPGFECQVDQSFGVLVQATGAFGNTFHHRLYSVPAMHSEPPPYHPPQYQQAPVI